MRLKMDGDIVGLRLQQLQTQAHQKPAIDTDHETHIHNVKWLTISVGLIISCLSITAILWPDVPVQFAESDAGFFTAMSSKTGLFWEPLAGGIFLIAGMSLLLYGLSAFERLFGIVLLLVLSVWATTILFFPEALQNVDDLRPHEAINLEWFKQLLSYVWTDYGAYTLYGIGGLGFIAGMMKDDRY